MRFFYSTLQLHSAAHTLEFPREETLCLLQDLITLSVAHNSRGDSQLEVCLAPRSLIVHLYLALLHASAAIHMSGYCPNSGRSSAGCDRGGCSTCSGQCCANSGWQLSGGSLVGCDGGGRRGRRGRFKGAVVRDAVHHTRLVIRHEQRVVPRLRDIYWPPCGPKEAKLPVTAPHDKCGGDSKS
jgi:hypothetical protein